MFARELMEDENGKPEDYLSITRWKEDGVTKVAVSLVTYYINHDGEWTSASGGRTFNWSVPEEEPRCTENLSIPLSLLNEGYEEHKG